LSTKIAEKIFALGADYLLAPKGNRPTLAADVAEYFRTRQTTASPREVHGGLVAELERDPADLGQHEIKRLRPIPSLMAMDPISFAMRRSSF